MTEYSPTRHTYKMYDVEEDGIMGGEGGGTLQQGYYNIIGYFTTKYCSLRLPCFSCLGPSGPICDTSGPRYCSLTQEGELPIRPTETLTVPIYISSGPGTVTIYGDTEDLEVLNIDDTPFTSQHISGGSDQTVTVRVRASEEFDEDLQLQARFLPDNGTRDTQDVVTLTYVPIEIEIIYEEEDIVGGYRTTVVGKRISLSAQSNAPPGQIPQWHIDGEIVEGYDPTMTPCQPDLLEAADLQQMAVAFNWISGGSKAVTCKIAGATAPTAFEVLRPTGTYTGIQTSSLGVNLVDNTFPFANRMWFGSDLDPGFAAGSLITPPAGFPGEAGTIQLIDQDVRLYEPVYDPMSLVVVVIGYDVTPISTPGFALDAINTNFYAGTRQVAGGETTSLATISDSPNEPIENYRVDRTDAFKDYLMYRSEGAGSIFVTIKVVEWGWHGSVEDGELVPARCGFEEDPTPYDSTELPRWTIEVDDVEEGETYRINTGI